jgi:hypothetical protein
MTSGLPRLADIFRVSRHVSKVPIPEVATPFDQRAGGVLTLSSARVGKGGSNLRCDGW